MNHPAPSGPGGWRRIARLATVAAAIAALATAAAGCGGSTRDACAPLEYEGAGDPEAILVTDLPWHGPARAQSLQINDAVRAELRARGFAAGAHTVGLLACDDSTPEAGGWDPKQCSANANEYADDDRVLAVLGPLDSRCAAIQLPVLNRAPGGGIPLVSPSNTYACLTRGGPGCDVSEPAKYYPADARTYLRLAGNDLFQAAADAEFARDRGLRRVYVLDDREAYGVGLATAFRKAAKVLGITIVGSESWDTDADSYGPLFDRIGGSRAQAIFLAGSIDSDGARLLHEKVAALGPNDGKVALLATDRFADAETLAEVGTAARGLLVSVPGAPTSAYQGEAKAYARALAADLPAGQAVDPGAMHGAEAARVILDAIGRSDGSRVDVLARLFRTRVHDGLIGSFRFDRNGDPADATGPVVGFTVLRMAKTLVPQAVVEPAPATVRAASAGT